MTLLGALNFVVLQWFFVRLAVVRDAADQRVGWIWHKRIIPLTGWWSDYRFACWRMHDEC
jgi:hypothetical protein